MNGIDKLFNFLYYLNFSGKMVVVIVVLIIVGVIFFIVVVFICCRFKYGLDCDVIYDIGLVVILVFYFRFFLLVLLLLLMLFWYDMFVIVFLWKGFGLVGLLYMCLKLNGMVLSLSNCLSVL